MENFRRFLDPKKCTVLKKILVSDDLNEFINKINNYSINKLCVMCYEYKSENCLKFLFNNNYDMSSLLYKLIIENKYDELLQLDSLFNVDLIKHSDDYIYGAINSNSFRMFKFVYNKTNGVFPNDLMNHPIIKKHLSASNFDEVISELDEPNNNVVPMVSI